jgi:hypothetical protein
MSTDRGGDQGFRSSVEVPEEKVISIIRILSLSGAYMKTKYVKAAEEFQSEIMQMTTVLDNMISTLLGQILGQAVKLKLERKSTRHRIEKFNEQKAILSNRYSGNIDGLIQKLDDFERMTINVKHGKIIEGLDVIAFSKDNDTHKFDEKTIDGIRNAFRELRKGLHEISYNLEHRKTV